MITVLRVGSHTFVFILQHGFLHQVGTQPVVKQKEGGRKWQGEREELIKSTVESQVGRNFTGHLMSPSVTSSDVSLKIVYVFVCFQTSAAHNVVVQSLSHV